MKHNTYISVALNIFWLIFHHAVFQTFQLLHGKFPTYGKIWYYKKPSCFYYSVSTIITHDQSCFRDIYENVYWWNNMKSAICFQIRQWRVIALRIYLKQDWSWVFVNRNKRNLGHMLSHLSTLCFFLFTICILLTWNSASSVI